MRGVLELKELIADNSRVYVKISDAPVRFREELRPLKYSLSGGCIKMVEDGADATLQSVYLVGLDSSGIALKLDDFKLNIFCRGAWNKAVDYLILTTYNNNDYAIFIDLKSSLNDQPDPADSYLIVDSNEDYKKEMQFVGAEALFDYIKLIVKKSKGSNVLPQYTIRKWILYNSIKPRPGVQATAMSTAARRNKSTEVRTKYVADASTIDLRSLI